MKTWAVAAQLIGTELASELLKHTKQRGACGYIVRAISLHAKIVPGYCTKDVKA